MATSNDHLSIDLSAPSEDLLQWAKENIGEDPQEICQQLEAFKDLIYNKGECTLPRNDDKFLLRFLRARYFIVPRAHRLLVNHYKFKGENAELFQDINLKIMVRILNEGIVDILPYHDQTGRRLVIYRFGKELINCKWDPKKYNINELFRVTLLLMACAIVEEQTQIKGAVCIIDLVELTTTQAWHLTPNVAYKIVQILVTTFPLRIHAIHIINQGWLFDTVYRIFKQFLKPQMTETIFFHGGNLQSLHEHIDPTNLPQAYGGQKLDCNECSDWLQMIKENTVILEELKNWGFQGINSHDMEQING